MRKERVSLIIPRCEFDSLGILAHADVPGVCPVRLRRKTGLHPVEHLVECAVLEPKARECAGGDLGDRRLRSLPEHDICGRAGDKRQATRIDEAHAVVFSLYRRLVSVVLKVPWETGSQSRKVAL